MKKFLLSLALVLVSGAVMAQSVYEVTDEKITSSELNEKTEATYIAIKNLSATNHYYFVGNTGAPYSKEDFSEEAVFVWQPVTEGQAGSYYLMKLDGTYMQTSSPKDFGTKENAAVFTTTNPTSQGSGSTKFNGDGDSQAYINGNDDANLVRFVTDNKWINVQNADSGTPTYNTGLGGWTIHYVYGVDEVSAVSVTYVYNLNGEEKKRVIVEQAIGSEFNAPAVPYVSFEYPEGNVTVETNEVDVTCTVAAPFEAASSYSNISQWYNLQIRDDGFTYLQYDAAKEYIPASQSAAPSSNKNSYAWGFVGNPFDGFEIVNYVAGETKVLSAPSAPTGDKNAAQLARMVVKNDATGNTAWRIEPATHANAGANTFYVVHPDNTDYAFNRQSYNSENSLCYWNGRDTGSALRVVACEISNLGDELVAIVEQAETLFGQIAVGDGLGEYSSSYDNYVAKYNEIAAYSENIPAEATDAELEAHIATMQAIIASFTLNMPEAGTFLRIKNNADYYLVSGTHAERVDFSVDAATTSNSIFYFDGDKLLSFETGMYLAKRADENFIGYAQSVGSSIDISFAASGTLGKYNIKFNNGRYFYSVDASSNAGSSDGGDGYRFNLEEVTELPVTISAAGYATFYAPVAVQVEGITANTVMVNGEWATLNAIEGGVVPANTGVILSGNEGTYDLAITETEATIDSGLEGTVAATYVEGPAYVLSNQEGVVGLYKAKLNKNAEGAEGDTHFLNNGFKAYLVTETPAAVLKFNLGGNTTAIETVLNSGVDANAPIYDLSGRRVNNVTKGIYIQNGKKVVK